MTDDKSKKKRCTKNCVAYGCSNLGDETSKQAGITFHRFPMSQPSRVKVWEHAMHCKDFRATKWSRICSFHFKPECFDRTGHTVRLRKDATPTIFNIPKHLQTTTKERSPPTYWSKSTGLASSATASSSSACGETVSSSNNSDLPSTSSLATTSLTNEHTYALPSRQKLKRSLSNAIEGVEQCQKRLKTSDQRLRRLTAKLLQSTQTESVEQKTSEQQEQMLLSTQAESVAEKSSEKHEQVHTTVSSPSMQGHKSQKVWGMPSRIAYGTPRRIKRDHGYALGLLRARGVQTDMEVCEQYRKTCQALSPATASVEADTSAELFSLESTDDDRPPEHAPSTDTDAGEQAVILQTAVDMKKYIVFEENLDELHKFCNRCGAPVTQMSKHTTGSMISYTISCHMGHSYIWHSQPVERKQPAGNLLISGAILATGETYSRMRDFASALNLQFPSKTTYNKIQKNNLLPVVQEKWEEEKSKAMKEVKDLGDTVLAGDARCDSPGHMAKYGSYTMMHIDGEGQTGTQKIIAMNLVQVSEVKNSNHMEPEGMERCLKEVKEAGVKVKVLATDRHIMVGSIMKKTHPEIEHQFDTWHVSKNVVKQLNSKAKTKQFEELGPWIQSLSNHLWWCCATCDGDEQLLREKWLSILHHVLNKHRWSGNVRFHKCAHAPLSNANSIKWMQPTSPAFAALKSTVMHRNLLKSLPHLTKFCHTGELEVFHNMLLKYCPKRLHFHYEAMSARLMLAAIEWNNTRRQEQVDDCGQPASSVIFSKRRKCFVLRKKYTHSRSDYVRQLLCRAYDVHKDNLVLPAFRKPSHLRAVSGGAPKPAKGDLQHKFKSRFRK